MYEKKTIIAILEYFVGDGNTWFYIPRPYE